MLVFSDVRKSYRNLEVLKGLTLSVPRGSLFGLMGQNGAGKTTLLRIAAGLLAPDSGELLVGGIDVRQRPEEAKRLIGFVPDGFGAYDNMSVLEYMSFFASCFGLGGRNARLRNEELLRRVGLFERRDSLVTELSKGMQQRLSLARALIHDPELLVLDEPTSGLDPLARGELLDMLSEFMTSERHSVLFSTHITSDLDRIADMVTILDAGRVIASGSRDDLLEMWVMVRGGVADLTDDLSSRVRGLRRHSVGWEGLLPAADLGLCGPGVVAEAPSIEELLVHLAKEYKDA